MRTRIKICGITRVEDALAACEYGADAIGFIFYAPSSRHIEIEQAVAIGRQLPAFVNKIAVVVEPERDYLKTILKHVPISAVQFHGAETPEFCESFGSPFIKTVSVKVDTDIEAKMAPFTHAQAILVDTFDGDLMGGSGKTFAWDKLPLTIKSPLILAGGLDANNVTAAIESVKPYALDVSSGVESAKGVKDHGKIKAFCQAVKDADASA